VNLYPIVSRDLGLPQEDYWMGTYHESEMAGARAALAITKNYCFLVDPAGPVDDSNICCSMVDCASNFAESWPPSAYINPVPPTTTDEATKILPDGVFTAGTHIEYFVRRSRAGDPGLDVGISPDTNLVTHHIGGKACADQYRWLEVDVLPDLWKSPDYGGEGLACMLIIDAADCLGEEPAWFGTLDSLGSGKQNGASRGWKVVDPNNPSPDNPAGYVYPNLGQPGRDFDKYDIQGVANDEGGHPGCRIAPGAPPSLYPKQCKSGPTPDMLKEFYRAVVWFQGELETSIHNGADFNEQADDITLLTDYLLTATIPSERSLWINGDNVASDLETSLIGQNLRSSHMGAGLRDPNYRAVSANTDGTIEFDPIAAPFRPAKAYGMSNLPASRSMDVLDALIGPVQGVIAASEYENVGPNGPYTASAYRASDFGAARFYSTLIDGFKISAVTGGLSKTDVDNGGRRFWIFDALKALGCIPPGPVVAVGDLPGGDAGFRNFVLGAHPNPVPSPATNIRFAVDTSAEVAIRFYNVAGRLIHQANVKAQAGENTYKWNGVTSTGVRVSPGVYFYRLSSPGRQFENNQQRIVILGGSAR
jgi:hypothetical protein